MSPLEVIGKSKNVSLTTFRKDGRAVPTAVWFVIDEGTVYVLTPPTTGKVKRIRNNGRATLTPCDARGRIPAGAPTTEGTARILPDSETARIHNLMVRRYFLSRVADLWTRLTGRRRPSVAIAITL